MKTSDLSNAQWERLRPVLPPQKPHTGRPARDHRTVLNGILWVLRTGSPWRALPERDGSWDVWLDLHTGEGHLRRQVD